VVAAALAVPCIGAGSFSNKIPKNERRYDRILFARTLKKSVGFKFQRVGRVARFNFVLFYYDGLR
jgi:hypothetical protein